MRDWTLSTVVLDSSCSSMTIIIVIVIGIMIMISQVLNAIIPIDIFLIRRCRSTGILSSWELLIIIFSFKRSVFLYFLKRSLQMQWTHSTGHTETITVLTKTQIIVGLAAMELINVTIVDIVVIFGFHVWRREKHVLLLLLN